MPFFIRYVDLNANKKVQLYFSALNKIVQLNYFVKKLFCGGGFNLLAFCYYDTVLVVILSADVLLI